MAIQDPTGGGVGQAAKELLREMQKAQAEMQQVDKLPGSAEPNQAFLQAMEQAQATQQAQQVIEAKSVQQAKAAQSASEVLKRARADVVGTQATQVGQAESSAQSKLAHMLHNLIRGQDKMNEVMKMALSGRQFSPPELIVMQAGVYRFTQELELTGKVVEKATSGIKQTMNTQV